MLDPWRNSELSPAIDWTVEAELERIHRQAAASVGQQAVEEAREAELLAALMPASSVFAQMLRRIEATSRTVRRYRRHEVTVFLRQPAPDCIRASLRWGPKFALTDGERQLMRSYQTRRRRLQRYPDVVVAHQYCELGGTFDGTRNVLELGRGRAVPIPQFRQDPSIVASLLDEALAAPELRVQRYHKSKGYEADPSG